MANKVTQDEIALLLPWYANGTLAREERDRVESHLPGCASCRGLLEEARLLLSLSGESAVRLSDHVQAGHLERFATEPESLEPDLAAWIRGHLKDCGPCEGALRILRRTLERPAPEVSPGDVPARIVRGPWATLRATVLHPAAAAAYLALLLLSAPLYRDRLFPQQAPPAEPAESSPALPAPVPVTTQAPSSAPPQAAAAPWSGAVDLPVLSAAARGGGDPPSVVVETGQQLVLIGVEFDIPEPVRDEEALRFTVRSAGGEELWRAELPARRAARSLREEGFVSLLVPAAALDEGGHALVVSRPGAPGGGALLEAPFRLVRHGS